MNALEKYVAKKSLIEKFAAHKPIGSTGTPSPPAIPAVPKLPSAPRAKPTPYMGRSKNLTFGNVELPKGSPLYNRRQKNLAATTRSKVLNRQGGGPLGGPARGGWSSKGRPRGNRAWWLANPNASSGGSPKGGWDKNRAGPTNPTGAHGNKSWWLANPNASTKIP